MYMLKSFPKYVKLLFTSIDGIRIIIIIAIIIIIVTIIIIIIIIIITITMTGKFQDVKVLSASEFSLCICMTILTDHNYCFHSHFERTEGLFFECFWLSR